MAASRSGQRVEHTLHQLLEWSPGERTHYPVSPRGELVNTGPVVQIPTFAPERIEQLVRCTARFVDALRENALHQELDQRSQDFSDATGVDTEFWRLWKSEMKFGVLMIKDSNWYWQPGNDSHAAVQWCLPQAIELAESVQEGLCQNRQKMDKLLELLHGLWAKQVRRQIWGCFLIHAVGTAVDCPSANAAALKLLTTIEQFQAMREGATELAAPAKKLMPQRRMKSRAIQGVIREPTVSNEPIVSVKCHGETYDIHYNDRNFIVPAELVRLLAAFLIQIVNESACDVVKWQVLNRAVDPGCETSEKASDKLRHRLKKLNDALRDGLGATPNDLAWLITKKGWGVLLNDSITWEVDDGIENQFCSPARLRYTDPHVIQDQTPASDPERNGE